MPDIFDQCTDSCGWIAALIASVSYGSFGVPIKETRHIEVHPLILQSYKTVTMFCMSWTVLWMGVHARWTPWGLLSGFMWVLGGAGGIYAIRMVGMAVAIGCWASVMIMVNFTWGILIFQEPIANIFSTMGAFVFLTLGLIGMSYYSSPQLKENAERGAMYEEVDGVLTTDTPTMGHSSSRNGLLERQLGDEIGPAASTRNPNYETLQHRDTPDMEDPTSSFVNMNVDKEQQNGDTVTLGGLILTKRAAGLAGAVFNGIMTGSSLIPLHYAKAAGFGGAHYMISFASGALVTNTLLWVGYFAYEMVHAPLASTTEGTSTSRLRTAYNNMPDIHFSQLWLPGMIAGILLTIAMFGTFIAVTYLGQGVGNSIVQSKILVSGLWGIVWYKEIKGCSVISKWFLAASCTMLGIIWLSYERLSATAATTEGNSDGHRRMLVSLLSYD